ncbi:ABC transporter substrate-binding protein [Thermodesulfobacteriota bacterium]
MKENIQLVLIIMIGLLILLFLGFNLYGCSPDNSKEYAGPIEKLKIGIDKYACDFYGLLFLAEIEGFFESQGLEISFVRLPSGPHAFKALRQGSVDMGTATEFPFVKEIIQGRSLMIITTVWRGDLIYLSGRRDRGIQKPSDLRGKKIAIPMGTQFEFFLGRYLLYHDMTLEDIAIIDKNLIRLLDPVIWEMADGVVSSEPDLPIARKGLGGNIVSWPIQGDQLTYGLIACRSEFVKSKPDIINRFLHALHRAELYYEGDPQKARALILGHPIRKDSLFKDSLPLLSYGLFLEKPFLVMMEDEARWSIERGESVKKDVPNFLDFIYFDGLESVKPDGISIIR